MPSPGMGILVKGAKADDKIHLVGMAAVVIGLRRRQARAPTYLCSFAADSSAAITRGITPLGRPLRCQSDHVHPALAANRVPTSTGQGALLCIMPRHLLVIGLDSSRDCLQDHLGLVIVSTPGRLSSRRTTFSHSAHMAPYLPPVHRRLLHHHYLIRPEIRHSLAV